MIKRVGGLWFWRIGRLGGSVYLARRKVRTYQETIAAYPPINEADPYVQGYLAIAAAAAAMIALWLVVGFKSGFIL